jgi:DNA-directed RNA polymerase alpha subunit
MKAGLMDVQEVSLWSDAELRGIHGIGPKSLPVIRQMLLDHGLTLAHDAELAGKVA